MSTAPKTIVLIHGFWVTPRSWEQWKARYEARGFVVHTPAYPGSRSRSRRCALTRRRSPR
jgi:esterase/lipase